MSFQSVLYVLFLIVCWCVSMLGMDPRWRKAILLCASYLFYASWGIPAVLVLIGSSVFNYWWAKLLRLRSSSTLLWAGLLANLALLVLFKCADTLSKTLGVGGGAEGLRILAALGLSFYTFQAMSYLIDVYRGQDARPSVTEFLLYMAFWPTVLAGPICRASEMVPQFRSAIRPSYDDVAAGSRRIIFGLFMKVVVADTLARGITAGEGVTFGFDRASGSWSAPDVLFLAVGYGFQLFFDFAGYSNIAIGSARVFGIKVRENFNDPYLSTSPSEFWKRWHMSLSSWIRDYVFFPLSTLRSSLVWRNLALLVSMTAFGLWHGFSANFILWGFCQGLLVVAQRQIQNARKRHPSLVFPKMIDTPLSWALTFLPISLGWILFRSGSLSQAGRMYEILAIPSEYHRLSMRPNYYILVALIVVGYFIFRALERIMRRLSENRQFGRVVWLFSPAYYAVTLFVVIAWSKQASTFVYFQF